MWTTNAMNPTNSTILRIVCWLQERLLEVLAFDNNWMESQHHPRSVPEAAQKRRASSSANTVEEEYIQAVNVTKDTLVASRVNLAITSEERRHGLLDRQQMATDEGLYIVPTQWIHMFGMRFPIDVAFLSSSGRVLWIQHNIKPNRFSRLVWRADGALELAAGTLQASNTEVGDTIELRVPPTESKSRRVF